MKKLIGLLLLIGLFSCSSELPENPVINLNTSWKFITGDSMAYANPEFDYSSWAEIKMDKIWEEQGFDPYDGYAWFRTKVFIPSSLRDKSYMKDSLRIFLGKINNFDQTFLNGSLIGINNKNMQIDSKPDETFINAPTNYWDLERRYTLASNDPRILWDQENVIAVRVYDEGGQGGMYTGNQELSMTSILEYLQLDNGKTPFDFEGKSLHKKTTIQNTSATRTIKGKFLLLANGKMDGESLFRAEEQLSLKPGESKTFDIQLEQLEQSALLTYQLDITKANQSLIAYEESPYILTPLPDAKPRINGAAVYGARPGHPFLYKIPATGDEPLSFAAEGLPIGLILDKTTGIITGTSNIKGDYNVKLTVKNNIGEDSRSIVFRIGDQIALTPPMGWNSWNCWGLSVDTEKAIASAKVFKQKGLADHGWSYINLDDGWEIHKDVEPKRNENGQILTNEKFPDMKALGDSIHALGLKFGIYSSPGPLTCGGYTASYQHEMQDAQSFADWGIDYLKYDWCSYEDIAKDHSRPELMKPYLVMRDCLNKANRDIVYSLCQYGMGSVWEWGREVGGNLWRTTGDITDTWESMSGIGFNQVENASFAKPGHWNDPDMLVVGWVGWGPNLHPSRLTPDEQYTHISLWSLLSAPLLIGCDLERLDAFTLNLLTNDEVLAINQDALGKQAIPMMKNDTVQVWVKELADGNKALGVFNLGNQTEKFTLNTESFGIKEGVTIRDLWRQKDLGMLKTDIEVTVASHGVVLLKLIK